MGTVTVFGGADPGPGDPLYEDALEAARRLARAGFDLATGGYGGIMEAVSRGAREEGAAVTGVTSPAFQGLEPNRWVGEVIAEDDLFTRTRRLIQVADAFLVFPGRSGTLSEIAFVWALVRSRQAPERPVALVGERWDRLLAALVAESVLEERVRRRTRALSDGGAAASWLIGALAEGGDEAPASGRLE